jgi:hypothetical protein
VTYTSDGPVRDQFTPRENNSLYLRGISHNALDCLVSQLRTIGQVQDAQTFGGVR